MPVTPVNVWSTLGARIAEVQDFDGFGGTFRIANDSLGVFVGNFGKADVGAEDFKFAGRWRRWTERRDLPGSAIPVWKHQSR